MDQAVEEKAAPKAPLAVLTTDELAQLNLASSLHDLARRNFERVWAPIKAAHGLPEKIIYKRDTGEVVRDG